MVDDLADQRVAAERAGELGQVVVDAEGEPHPLDRQLDGLAPGGLAGVGRPGAKHDPLACGCQACTTTRPPGVAKRRDTTEPRRRATPSPPRRERSR